MAQWVRNKAACIKAIELKYTRNVKLLEKEHVANNLIKIEQNFNKIFTIIRQRFPIYYEKIKHLDFNYKPKPNLKKYRKSGVALMTFE